MWISLFTIVLAIALGFGLGAVIIESDQKDTRRASRRRPVRVRS
jgi:hypothetical protein